jgi:hypothetical protein
MQENGENGRLSPIAEGILGLYLWTICDGW